MDYLHFLFLYNICYPINFLYSPKKKTSRYVREVFENTTRKLLNNDFNLVVFFKVVFDSTGYNRGQSSLFDLGDPTNLFCNLRSQTQQNAAKLGFTLSFFSLNNIVGRT